MGNVRTRDESVFTTIDASLTGEARSCFDLDRSALCLCVGQFMSNAPADTPIPCTYKAQLHKGKFYPIHILYKMVVAVVTLFSL